METEGGVFKHRYVVRIVPTDLGTLTVAVFSSDTFYAGFIDSGKFLNISLVSSLTEASLACEHVGQSILFSENIGAVSTAIDMFLQCLAEHAGLQEAWAPFYAPEYSIRSYCGSR
jgi:hypothetical protein